MEEKEYIGAPEFRKTLEEFKSEIMQLIMEKSPEELPFFFCSQSDKIGQLCSALSQAQGEYTVAGQDRQGYEERYASWEEVKSASVPALSKHGISVLQQVISSRTGEYYLRTHINHADQYMDSYFRILPSRTDVHAFNSSITLTKKFTYCAALGVVDGMDDNGQEASKERLVEEKKGTTIYHKKKSPNYSIEVISEPELQEIYKELEDLDDAEHVIQGIKRQYDIHTLANIPKNELFNCLKKIREIKQIRNG
jgi:hypothetical protein